jgi:hypothetical protein
MTIAMQPIYTQTTNGSVNGVNFNNIPQTFTDLRIVVSVRSTSPNIDALGLFINGVFSAYTRTALFGTGSGVGSSRAAYRDVANIPSTAITANTFNSVDIYVPNYTSSNFKQFTVDGVMENNATAANLGLVAYLLSSTSPITSIGFDSAGQGVPFAANSTFTLYGITKG